MTNRSYYFYRITDTVKTFFVSHSLIRRLVFIILIVPYFLLFLLEFVLGGIRPFRMWLKENVLQFDNRFSDPYR